MNSTVSEHLASHIKKDITDHGDPNSHREICRACISHRDFNPATTSAKAMKSSVDSRFPQVKTETGVPKIITFLTLYCLAQGTLSYHKSMESKHSFGPTEITQGGILSQKGFTLTGSYHTRMERTYPNNEVDTQWL